MRALIIVLTFILIPSLLGFIVENLGARSDVTVWRTTYFDVPMYLVVILSVFVGIVYAGLIAVAEGAHIRLANRRLSREVRKLETEINYLRTEPPSMPKQEPDELPARSDDGPPRERKSVKADAPASAPVYDTDVDEWPSDDDDIYSGGRAV